MYTRLAQGRIESIALGLVHDGVHRLADLAYYGIDLALICEVRRQDLAQRVEPGIDGRHELLATDRRQVDLQRRLVQDTVEGSNNFIPLSTTHR